MSTQEIRIDNQVIGLNHKPYVIAEVSANHNGHLQRALDTIEMAKKSGADAVKIQTYTADTMTIRCSNDDFQIRGGLWDGYTLYDLYEEAHTPYEWHRELFDFAKKIGITIFSTPFDESAVDLLESLNAPAYKIASFEATDIPLIQYVAKTGKPMIISTGMATHDEIEDAVSSAREAGCEDIVLLHCISGYPTPVEQSNLKTIPELSNEFDVVSGLSDHSLGTTVSVASVALGACVIEKHVTLNRSAGGPDSAFSLEPDELATLCYDVDVAWKALGQAGYERKAAEEGNVGFRRSVYVVEDIKAGELFTEKNIRRIRPGFGMSPKHYPDLIGKMADIDLKCGTAMKWKYVR